MAAKIHSEELKGRIWHDLEGTGRQLEAIKQFPSPGQGQ